MHKACAKRPLFVTFRTGGVVFLFWLILAGAAIGVDSRFYFVQITDTHLGIAGSRDQNRDRNMDRTARVVKAINALPMEVTCVVHTGDIIDRRTLDHDRAMAAAVSVFKGLTPALYFLPGNNDIGAFVQRDRDLYEKYFGSLISQAEYKGVVFLFVYTDPLRTGVAMDGYDPFAAVETYLDATHGKPVLLFHHGPSVDDFYNNRFHGGWTRTLQENWVKLINRYNVKAVIAGHFHRDEFHWLGDVPLYVSPPVAEKWGRQACFRIYSYQDGKIEYTTQYLE